MNTIDTHRQFLEAEDRRRTLMASANGLNKTIVFDALAALGATSVTVEFNGWGDEGQIEGMSARSGEAPITLPDTPVSINEAPYEGDALTTTAASLTEAIETLCYDFLEQEHCGWGNDDGAYGNFEFNVAERTIQLEYSQRSTDGYSHTF